MKIRTTLLTLLAAGLLSITTTAGAIIYNLHAELLGTNEVPPSGSAATGFARLILDTTAQTLTGHIEFSGLGSNTTAAHIHCCLATPYSVANVGVATLVPAFPNFPLGVTSGTDDFVLNLASLSAYNTNATGTTGFVGAQGGLAQAEAAFIAGLTSGRTYLNIHTTGFGGGEIRGFVIPEPMTLSLFGAAALAAGWASRRRKS